MSWISGALVALLGGSGCVRACLAMCTLCIEILYCKVRWTSWMIRGKHPAIILTLIPYAQSSKRLLESLVVTVLLLDWEIIQWKYAAPSLGAAARVAARPAFAVSFEGVNRLPHARSLQ